MSIRCRVTDRGFVFCEFVDRYNEPCQLLESSLAEEACIWLGADGKHMHLTQAMVSYLLPLLSHFAETGKLLPVYEPEHLT